MNVATEDFFDFLRGDRTISLSSVPEPIHEKTNFDDETWCLYTLNSESVSCPLDCLIIEVKPKIHVFIFKFLIVFIELF